MKITFFYLVLLLSFFLGCMLFLIQYEYIIFQWSHSVDQPLSKSNTKEKKGLYFFNNDQWHKDSIYILWHKDSIQNNIMSLLQHWIHYVYEENIIERPSLAVQSVLYDSKVGRLYISFNHSPFSAHWSIQQKLLCLEGMIRTINYAYKENTFTIKWLVHHKPLQDDHLDFS